MPNNICVIPPSPDLVNQLKEEYKKEKKKNKKLTEIEFFIKKGYFQNKIFGKDNNIINDPDEPINRDIALMPLPRFKPRGNVNVLFLLVDFNDKPHNQTVDHFKKLLFSDGNSNFSQKSLK